MSERKGNDRISLPYMTKYEKTVLLGKRATMIANGSPITIKNPETTNPIEIAEKELFSKTIPLKIVRVYPGNIKEVWSVNELQILD